MKLTKRDILVLLYIISVVGLIAVYNFVVSPSMEETDEVVAANAGLEEQVKVLEGKVEQKPQLEKEIDEMITEVVDITSIYPKKITEEDIVCYVNEVNEELDMNVTSVSFSEPTVVYTVIGNGDASKYSMALNQITVNVDYSTDYEGFKRIVNYINEDKDHREITSVNIGVSVPEKETEESEGEVAEEETEASEEKQILSGNFSLMLYYLDGKTTNEDETSRYDKTEFPHGLENIFE